MTDEDTISLSRRKALGAIGTIGAAGALGTMGTFAQFSDTENGSVSFTAGGIDGTLEFNGSYNGNQVNDGLDNVNFDGAHLNPGGVDVDAHFTDIKPGDYGCVNVSITVQNNPAWVASCLEVVQDIDNRDWEPEIEADDDVHSTGTGSTDPGELAENILTLPYYDSDGTCTFFDSDGMAPDNLPNDFSVPSGFWSNSQDSGSGGGADDYLAPRTIDDVVSNGGWKNTIVWNGSDDIHITAPDGASVGEGCVFLDGQQAGGPSADNTRGVSPLSPGDTLNFGYDFHLPFETGNVVQGDRLTLKLGFVFLQTRHTSKPDFGSYDPGSNTPNNSTQ